MESRWAWTRSRGAPPNCLSRSHIPISPPRYLAPLEFERQRQERNKRSARHRVLGLIPADSRGRVLVDPVQREVLLHAFEQSGQSAMAYCRLQDGLTAAPGLIAHVLISKYYDHLPFYRQETIDIGARTQFLI